MPTETNDNAGAEAPAEEAAPKANGHDKQPAPPMPNPTAMLDAQVNAFLHPGIVGIAGLLQGIPGEAVLLSHVRVLAKLVGIMYAGDEEAVKKFRRAARVAFAETLFGVPIAPLPAEMKAAIKAAQEKARAAAPTPVDPATKQPTGEPSTPPMLPPNTTEPEESARDEEDHSIAKRD